MLGSDACGSFNYCCHCNKSVENPCENALNTFNNPDAQVKEEKVAKKSTCKTAEKKTTKSTTSKTTKTTKKSTK